MVGVARLHGDVQIGQFDGQIVKQPLMKNLDDIAAGLTDNIRHRRQGAGAVADGDPQSRHLPGADHAAHQHGRQNARVDVGAAHDKADSLAREPVGEFAECGERNRARAFAQNPGVAHHSLNGGFDRGFID